MKGGIDYNATNHGSDCAGEGCVLFRHERSFSFSSSSFVDKCRKKGTRMKCFSFSTADPESKRRTFPWLRSLSSGSRKPSESSHTDRSQASSDPSTSSSRLTSSSSSSHKPRHLRVFSYAELKTATGNFHRRNLIGEGGFGCVYKGSILHDKETKMEVAIKKLNQKGQQGHKEWLAEVHFLGLVEHKNLVKLVGYCAEDNETGIQRLLVYEFLPNKSLEAHLFQTGPYVLPWNKRLNIALDAARGLAYLHEEITDLQVILRDFKSSNLLLEDDFNAKLSDFGLARQGPDPGHTHVSTEAVGTMGYAAPEYIQTGHLTSKSDVWSFGIVLLELISGRRCLDRNRPKNEQRLLEWAKPYLQDGKKYHLILDPRLDGRLNMLQVQKVVPLVLQCLARHPRTRPTMSEVAENLKQIVEIGLVAGSPQASPSSVLNRNMDLLTEDPAIMTNGKRRLSLLKEVRLVGSSSRCKTHVVCS